MNRQKPFHRAAGVFLFATAMLLASSQASATCGMRIPSPASTVTPQPSGTYDYAYTLTGEFGSCVNFFGPTNYVINAFEMPYFADAGVTAIQSPTGWTAHVDTTDAFGLGGGAETLVWTAAAGFGLAPATEMSGALSLSGFGYTADFTSAYATAGYLTGSSTLLLPVDPALPGSPEALADGLVLTSFPSASAVPEPSVPLTMLAGLGLVAAARRRRA